jgi:hypothetical protein
VDCSSLFPRASVVALLCLVVGCGGGGGELSTIALNSGNAETVAAQGVGAAQFLMQMSELVGGVSDVIESQNAQTILCDSGNVGININDAVPQNVLSTGDSATITFQACMIDGLTLNGTLAFTATQVSGSEPGPFAYVLDVDFNAFTMSAGGATIVVNGGFTIDLSTTDGVSYVAIVSGDSLSAFAQGGGEAFSGTISDFRIERQYNESTGDYLFDVQATVATSEIGGIATYVTATPFTGTDPNGPSAGEYVVTGANGATLTITALGSDQVQLDLDLDGDTVVDWSTVTTWTFLDSL